MADLADELRLASARARWLVAEGHWLAEAWRTEAGYTADDYPFAWEVLELGR